MCCWRSRRRTAPSPARIEALTRDLLARVDELERRYAGREPSIHAFLPEDGRFDRLRREGAALRDQPERVGPLFGLLFGVKDIFHVDGFETRAGSRVPPSALAGPQGDSVSRLKAAGALMVGKTVTTEFAYFTPGPTRNPHNRDHTPGGSSSGSAAAVAAGLCDFALGTQTIGSIIRPASFCGIVGLKPTFGRIPAQGIVACAPSFDHVGLLATDVSMATRVARVLYATWADPAGHKGPPYTRSSDAGRPLTGRLALGVPAGPYLDIVPPGTAAWFERVCRALADAGHDVRRVPVMSDFQEIRERHETILAGEAARVHAAWFREYEPLYGDKIASLVRRGQSVTDEQLDRARAGRRAFRDALQQQMIDAGIDAWICPSTLGPAPEGIDSTGDPVMNLPWTQAGLPAVGLPAGAVDGLPIGLQVIGQWNADELLLAHAVSLEQLVHS